MARKPSPSRVARDRRNSQVHPWGGNGPRSQARAHQAVHIAGRELPPVTEQQDETTVNVPVPNVNDRYAEDVVNRFVPLGIHVGGG
jgi:hypothetical protein